MKENVQQVAAKEAVATIPFKAVIFDMDGTLIASTEADYLAWKRLFADHNIDLTYEKYFPLLGMRSAEVVKSQLHLDGAALDEALHQKLIYFEDILAAEGMQLIPGADVFLKSLKNYPVKIGLATSSRSMKMKMVMKVVGLFDYFDAIVTGEEVVEGKPFPDIFIKAAGKLNVAPQECLVIEDAVNGVLAAKNAHMKCIAITTTHDTQALQEAKADLVIDTFENLDFEELCDKLKK
jgi:HAD superfamily hydrolase (TIGR01509 family)